MAGETTNTWNTDPSIWVDSSNNTITHSGMTYTTYKTRKDWLGMIKRLLSRKRQPSVKNYFQIMKKSMDEVRNTGRFEANALVLINKARDAEQEHLADRLQKELDKYKAELKAFDNGFTIVIDEKKLIEKKPNDVYITPLSRFLRPLPDDVQEAVKEAKSLGIFYKFMVVHHDPQKENVAPDPDPIIFGVCQGTSRWFFIADWIDEHCALTLDKLIEEGIC